MLQLKSYDGIVQIRVEIKTTVIDSTATIKNGVILHDLEFPQKKVTLSHRYEWNASWIIAQSAVHPSTAH